MSYFTQIKKLKKCLDEAKRLIASERLKHDRTQIAAKAAGDLIRSLRIKQTNFEQKVIFEAKNNEQLRFDYKLLLDEKSQLETTVKDKSLREECLKKQIEESALMLKKSQDENHILKNNINVEHSRIISSEHASQELYQRGKDALRDCKRLKKEKYKLNEKMIGMENHLKHLMERATTRLRTSQKKLKTKRQEVRRLKTVINDLSNRLVEKESTLASRKKEIASIMCEVDYDKKQANEERHAEITKLGAKYNVALLKCMDELKRLKDERDACVMEKESFDRETKALASQLQKESKQRKHFCCYVGTPSKSDHIFFIFKSIMKSMKNHNQ